VAPLTPQKKQLRQIVMAFNAWAQSSDGNSREKAQRAQNRQPLFQRTRRMGAPPTLQYPQLDGNASTKILQGPLNFFRHFAPLQCYVERFCFFNKII
jgi:hypothetical protein